MVISPTARAANRPTTRIIGKVGTKFAGADVVELIGNVGGFDSLLFLSFRRF